MYHFILLGGSHYYSFVYRGFLYCLSYSSPYNLYKIELTDPNEYYEDSFRRINITLARVSGIRTEWKDFMSVVEIALIQDIVVMC